MCPPLAALSRGAQARLQLPPENGPHPSLADGTWPFQRGLGPYSSLPQQPTWIRFQISFHLWVELGRKMLLPYNHHTQSSAKVVGLWLCDFVLIACCQLKWSSSHLYMKSTSWFGFFFFLQVKHSNLSLTLIRELFPDESSDTSSGTSCQTHTSSRVPHPSNDLHLWEVIYLQIY